MKAPRIKPAKFFIAGRRSETIMEFTGERFLPGAIGENMALEHRHRYVLAALCAQGKDVLDIASGEGYGSDFLAGTAHSVVGVDVSGEAVAHARQTYSKANLRFIQGSVDAIPLPDASVDLVVSFETIEHVTQQEEMLCEIKRVLRPDGLLCLSSPDRTVNADILPPNSNPYHVKELNRAELESLVSAHFQKHAIWGQKSVFGSLITRELPGPFRSWQLDAVEASAGTAGVPGTLAPKFYVLLATNGRDLPEFPLGILETPVEDSDFVLTLSEKFQEQLRQRDARLAELEEAQRNALHALSLMEHSKSWRLTKPLRFVAGTLRDMLAEPGVKEKLKLLGRRARDLSRLAAGKPRPAVLPEAAPRAEHAEEKILVALLSGEPETSGHVYRMERLAAALQKRHRVEHYTRGSLPQQTEAILRADLIWIWRSCSFPEQDALLQRAREAKIPIVFDVDDRCFHPEHFDAKLMDAIRSQQLTDISGLHDFGQLMHGAVSRADFCVGATEVLARALHEATQLPARVIPNGFDRRCYLNSVKARHRFLKDRNDELVFIGYAAGTPTHQADLRVAAPALAAVMGRRPEVRLVLFSGAVDVEEFPEFNAVRDRIVWRQLVPLEELPGEITRFDINIAPLEVDNPFCQAKSELKFFEAAVAGVPSVVSATPPMRAAVRHGENGFLAKKPEDWEPLLEQLIADKALRERMARNARRGALWTFGPENRERMALSLVEHLLRSPEKRADSFVANTVLGQDLPLPVAIPEYETVYSTGPAFARVAVVIPVRNAAATLAGALLSLRDQTMLEVDLVVVDDQSTDNSRDIARQWMQENKGRFASATLLRTTRHSGRALAKNAGVDYCHAEYVMLLDAADTMLPECMTLCEKALDASTAAVAYPDDGFSASVRDWEPFLLRHGDHVGATAMLRKAHWAALGGYAQQSQGCEDFDLWCKMAAHGFWGLRLPTVAARRGARAASLSQTDDEHISFMTSRHPWLRLK